MTKNFTDKHLIINVLTFFLGIALKKCYGAQNYQ
jgi:hypothetical protein